MLVLAADSEVTNMLTLKLRHVLTVSWSPVLLPLHFASSHFLFFLSHFQNAEMGAFDQQGTGNRIATWLLYVSAAPRVWYHSFQRQLHCFTNV